MNEPKQMQRAVESFVADVSVSMKDVVARLPDVDGRQVERDVTSEAFNLVTALIDVDRKHNDAELWGLIFSFWRLMPKELGAAKADDLRRSDLLVGRAAWLDQVPPMLDVFCRADKRFGTTHGRVYYDRALHLAFTVAALDASPSRDELQAIDGLRTHMLEALDGLVDRVKAITGRIDVSRHPLRAMNGHATTSAHGGPGPPHGTSILPCTTRIRTSPPYRRIHRNAGR